MNGPLAQIAALVCHGNAHLREMEVAPFFPNHSTCHCCDRVEFVELRPGRLGQTEEERVAQTPDAWFAQMKTWGAVRFALDHRRSTDTRCPEGTSDAFAGGGGDWGIFVKHPTASPSYWLARWDVWNQRAPEDRIWRVTYGNVGAAKRRQAAGQLHYRRRMATAISWP